MTLDGPDLPPPPPALARLLPPEAVAPRYEGRSLANLPAAVGRLLGVPEGWRAPPVGREALGGADEGAERVVLLLVDGVGWNRLRRQLAQDDAGFGELWARYGVSSAPLTSTSPCTTSVATTVLLGDGSSPAATGQLGYTYRLPSLGLVANMLFWKPAGHPGAASGELERWGLDPAAFLPTRSLAQVLADGGVGSHALLPAAYARSPLSRMQLRGARVVGHLGLTDLFWRLERWAEESAGRRAFAYAYHPDFDSLSHRDGADDPGWARLWEGFVAELARFLDRLPARSRRGLRLLVAADHGHVVTPREGRLEPQSLPGWRPRVALREGGEPRHVYVYTRRGAHDELRAYLGERLDGRFLVLSGEEALAAGLYGDPDDAHPEAAARLGDLVLLARGGRYLWDAEAPGDMRGMHGALEPDEMLVPLLQLDAGS